MQHSLIAPPLPQSAAAAPTMSAATEREAFAILVTRTQGPVFGFLYRMLGDVDAARDAAQETFLKACSARHRAVTHPTPLAWLFRIAANAARDDLRRRQRLRWLPWDASTHDRLLPASACEQPESAAILRERHDAVQRVLDRMTPRYREALLLREYAGLSCAEIGAATGKSTAAVKSLLFRAREEFRRIARESASDGLALGG
jgi:RNA polymerase sigma-70 factor, ECF subfamily